VVLLPFLGVLVYFIAEGGGMGQRKAQAMASAQADMNAHIRSVTGSGAGAAGEIAKAKELLDSGAISQAEFDQLKARALTG
jgi:hypothetical protein